MENEQEIAAEQAAIKEVNVEEVRAKVITEFGFDEVDDVERIDKLTAKEVENSKKLSAAIGQKIKHRTDAETLRNELRLKVTPATTEVKIDPADIDKKLDERLAQRDLDELDVSEALRKDIGEWARFKKIPVKQAARDPLFAPQIAEYEKAQKAEAASISRTNRSSGKTGYTFETPPDVDMATEDGRKEWDAYLADMKKKGY